MAHRYRPPLPYPPAFMCPHAEIAPGTISRRPATKPARRTPYPAPIAEPFSSTLRAQ